MKDITCIKKIIIWLPAVIIIIIMIFILTFQSPEKTGTLSMEAQEAVVSTVSNVGVERKKLIQCWWYDFNNFRRLAHIVEYFPLGIAVVIPFRIVYKKKPVRLSFLVCALVSLIDQSLKGILPTREGHGSGFDRVCYGNLVDSNTHQNLLKKEDKRYLAGRSIGCSEERKCN